MDLIDGSTGWKEELLNYTNSNNGLFGGVKGHRGSGAIIFMSRWFVRKAYEENNWGDKYDRFVLTRSDHFYECQHDLSILDHTPTCGFPLDKVMVASPIVIWLSAGNFSYEQLT